MDVTLCAGEGIADFVWEAVTVKITMNAQFDEAPLAVAATTMNPHLSSRVTASQNWLKSWSLMTDEHAN